MLERIVDDVMGLARYDWDGRKCRGKFLSMKAFASLRLKAVLNIVVICDRVSFEVEPLSNGMDA
jgi:hypothetical protein